MRTCVLIPLVLSLLTVSAQIDIDPAKIPLLMQGCWQAGDGGMQGEYCFEDNGLLRIKPKGRMLIQRAWEYDEKKALIVVSKGGKPFKYKVELLNDSVFVLYETKHEVRLIGKR